MSAYDFVRSGPKFTKLFLFNSGKIVLVNAVYILSLANPTLIFLYCLSNNVRYLQPVQKVFQEMPTHE